MKASERKRVDDCLHSTQVVVATGKYVGEGFDLPRLDTLFLAIPIAWKGSLTQYAGRIHQESEGKTQVTIHDYVDCGVPMLQRMFHKRELSYKTIGYTVQISESVGKLLRCRQSGVFEAKNIALLSVKAVHFSRHLLRAAGIPTQQLSTEIGNIIKFGFHQL